MDDAQAQQTNPLFGIIPKEFFTPLASPNRLVYWDCLCRLFQANGTAGRREKTHHLYVTKRNKAGTGMYFRIPVRSIDYVETKTDF